MEDAELERFLGGLEPEDLVRRLLAVSRRHEDVRFGLESEAGAAVGTFDLAAAKKQLTAQVAIGASSSRRGRRARTRRRSARRSTRSRGCSTRASRRKSWCCAST